jgi:hypothetical protein
MSEQERDFRRSDEPDVEGHRSKAYTEGSEPPEEDAERRESDEPDVEGHRTKA